MLFYPTRRASGPASTFRPMATGEAGDAMHLTWMLKSFIMGITLLGLSYWLVQVAGVQYLASLTSATLLAFLLAYVVWCLLHKNRHSRQTADRADRIEAGHSSPLVRQTEPQTLTPPPPFDHHQSYKFITAVPARDLSPPPSYEEAIRAMMPMGSGTPELTCHTADPPDSVSAPRVPASLPPSLSSTSITSPQSALTSSSALRLSSTSALTLESAPMTDALSALTNKQPVSASTPASQSTGTPPSSVDLTEASSTAVTSSSTATLTPS